MTTNRIYHCEYSILSICLRFFGNQFFFKEFIVINLKIMTYVGVMEMVTFVANWG